ncbi:hypothetical protein VNO78_23077 [Psophocarpus tetragonolobus]|uniref:Uncharacterized protein n=1 Tax=Psophocarpus tetragonolobus TaxID=3891 RepID=A0AAN9S3D5_PSOTE
MGEGLFFPELGNVLKFWLKVQGHPKGKTYRLHDRMAFVELVVSFPLVHACLFLFWQYLERQVACFTILNITQM